MGVQIPTRQGAVLMARKDRSRTCPDMSCGQYTQSHSAIRYGVDADWGVLGGVHVSATWRIRLNVHVRRRCSHLSNYFDHLFYYYQAYCQEVLIVFASVALHSVNITWPNRALVMTCCVIDVLHLHYSKPCE